MGYASKCDKAVADPDNPVAFSTCDRCGFVYNMSSIVWAYDYRGRQLANLRLRICERCQDVPQNQLRPRIIPPDPVPVANARPFPYCEAEVDDRTTTNPALPPVDFATSGPILLSGSQFIDGHQLMPGELVLVKDQTNQATNGIYSVSTGVWVRLGYDNARKKYIPASEIDTSYSRGVLYLQMLGIYTGAVYCARGANLGKLYQIDFPDTSGVVGVDPVIAVPAIASNVNRIDLFTGIPMEGRDFVRVTQEGNVRTPQQTGSAPGSLNEIPGYSPLVPGACDIGKPTQAPYGCANLQGLPPSSDVLPFAGPLWPTLQNQSIGVWLNDFGLPAVWVNNFNVQVTFNNYIWMDPGPGAPYRPVAFQIDYTTWVNTFGQGVNWNNTLNQTVFWGVRGQYGIFPPGGNVLWRDEKCVLTLWHNRKGDNVNWAEIYPNAIKPNKPGPWPFGWM